MSEISKQALLVDNSQSFPNNNAGAITPANLRAFNVNMIDSLVDEIGYNVDSASWNRSINALNTFTSSQQPTFNALNSFTASQLVTNTNLNLFTQSANQELDSLSAWTGSWEAWTSSINEIRDDGVFQGYSTRFYFNGLVSASIVQNVGGPIANVTIQQDGTKLNTSSFNEYTASTAATQSIFSASVATSISQSSNTFNAFSSSQNNFNLSATASIVELLNLSSSLSGGYATQGELDQSASVLQNNINALASLTASYATTGSNSFRGVQNINSISGTGLGEVYLLGRSGSLILGNSVSTPTYAALAHLSSSQINANTNLIFKDNTLTGSTIISGSGNIFSNPADAAAGRVNYIGGTSNLFLNGQSDQLPTITGSAASISGNRPTMNGNIINGTSTWQINQATNTGLHTYSNNILGGVNQWTFNTTGNTGIVDISNNLGINSTMVLNSPSRSVAEINAGASGSNALQISNNTLAGTFTYNGPVSSSTHTITRNTIAGTTTLNLQSGSRVLNFTANVINGAVTLNDNTVFAPTLGVGNTISINNINGTFIVNQRASSSINATSNNINNWTLSNDMDASAVPAANLRFQGLANNALFGGGNNNIYTSGSAPAIASQRAFASNIFGGQNISASAVANGTDANMVATIGVGFDLHVVGTARRDASNLTGAGATQGSAFFGRYNKLGQGFNTTAEVILAVGTGTSGSTGITRKTGLLIDSGSNVFVEGSLNVSGSLSFTGSVFGNVSASSITSQTASIDLSTANYFTLLLSGSTRINVNNPRPGVTATLVINTTTGASASFSSNVKQPSGSFYAASPSGNIDIISFTAVDSTTVYAFPAQSFV